MMNDGPASLFPTNGHPPPPRPAPGGEEIFIPRSLRRRWATWQAERCTGMIEINVKDGVIRAWKIHESGHIDEGES